MILAFVLFAVAVLRLHPDTPAAHWLHVALVERPETALARMERRHWIALVVLAGLCFAGAAGVTGELAWMLALDSSLYLDLLVAVGLASTLRTARSGWSVVRTAVGRVTSAIRARPRPRQARRVVAPPRAANDDGETRHAA